MSRPRRMFDREFPDGAVGIVKETGAPVAQVARDLGVNEGTLGTGCAGTETSAAFTVHR